MLYMPWYESDALKARVKCILEIVDDGLSVTDASVKYGVSRKTLHKWLSRYESDGINGLNDHSRAHHYHPSKTSDHIIARLLEVKERYRSWGPAKVRAYLVRISPHMAWPAASTIGSIFDAHGLVKKRRRVTGALRSTLGESHGPNDIWCVDFKGQFKVGRRYIYPLTLTDHYSRYLLGCHGCQRIKGTQVIKLFERWFECYGLPDRIRSDNGAPFAIHSRTSLTVLSTWWVKLGITLERIRPGNPQENGRHERFHRTLKQETASPPSNTFPSQQAAFDRFAYEYNNIRPHQALNGDSPGAHYQKSYRTMPKKIPAPEYPLDYATRQVRLNGEIKLNGKMVYVSNNLCSETVGIKEVEGDVVAIYFYHQPIMMLDLNTMSVINSKV